MPKPRYSLAIISGTLRHWWTIICLNRRSTARRFAWQNFLRPVGARNTTHCRSQRRTTRRNRAKSNDAAPIPIRGEPPHRDGGFCLSRRIKVLPDIEAPESVVPQCRRTSPFPCVNGYVLIPVDDGFLVGQIEWLTVERSAYPKRRRHAGFGLIDLPYPLRKMSLNPLGTLRKKSFDPEQGEGYSFVEEPMRSLRLAPEFRSRQNANCDRLLSPVSRARQDRHKPARRKCRGACGPRPIVRSPPCCARQYGQWQVMLRGRLHPVVT